MHTARAADDRPRQISSFFLGSFGFVCSCKLFFFLFSVFLFLFFNIVCPSSLAVGSSTCVLAIIDGFVFLVHFSTTRNWLMMSFWTGLSDPFGLRQYDVRVKREKSLSAAMK